MNVAVRLVQVLTALSVVAACHGQAPEIASAPLEDRRVTNLHAFARLYGVVRWFHPSDAAASTDWDRVAIEGARRIAGAGDDRALRPRSTSCFAA